MHSPTHDPVTVAYSAERLSQLEGFRDGLAQAARDLLATHLELPREVHYVADLQRWLLSQMTVAMHFEHELDPAAPPISPTNLIAALRGTQIASRNTVHSFLQELKRYGLVVPMASIDTRQRFSRATDVSEALIRRYFGIHLKALDRIDGGNRHVLSGREPRLIFHAQPRFVRLLLAQEQWYRPPQSIAGFVRSDSGSSVLHDLIRNVPSLSSDMTAPIELGKVSPKALSLRYRISRTHAARLFGQAREAGLMGWKNKSNRGDCWISPDLVRAYRHWQALKLAAVSQAFLEACETAGIELLAA